MKLARYMGGGRVEILQEDIPECPAGGLLVRTEASGLCSGELMTWYMDRKSPHVLGHEVVGRIVESKHQRFPVGERVFVHHHAPCMQCDFCRTGRYVHCEQWQRTKIIPGGLSEYFAVMPENLTDSFLVGEMDPRDSALIEPLACVVKSLRQSEPVRSDAKSAIIGLGVMGLMHALVLPGSVGFDLNGDRIRHAIGLGVDARDPNVEVTTPTFDRIVVCPGSQAAFDLALAIAAPAAVIVLFAPIGPGEELRVPQDAYFRDIRIVHSYSCGPDDTRRAFEILTQGTIRADQVVSHYLGIDELPDAYSRMRSGEILKPMVLFD